MSINSKSLVVVKSSRVEGYDIQFRFRTTLPNVLLALGEGTTYYFLRLKDGKVNLDSSLLNKLDGVSIGSGLNDSTWQKVFVAMNSSHLVLSANEEQTIYPISWEGLGNSSTQSFTTTYFGSTASYLKRLSDPPYLLGCAEDVIINGEWVSFYQRIFSAL